MNEKKLLLAITGPTASGKTAVAISIAKHFNTEIISCDSRQLYSEMPIGTAAPSIDELSQVKHHLVGNNSAKEPINATEYGETCQSIIKNLFKKYRLVVLVGGSGLYLDAALQGIDAIPDPNPAIRLQLQQRLLAGELGAMQAELQKADPNYCAITDLQNPRRVQRGLEVFLSTGKPLSSFQTQKSSRAFPSAIVTIEMSSDILYPRIDKRVDCMINNGLYDEAKILYPFRRLASMQTVGYQELFMHFDGDITLNKAIELIKSNTRKYARKQNNWFRRYNDAFHLDASRIDSVIKLAENLMKS